MRSVLFIGLGWLLTCSAARAQDSAALSRQHVVKITGVRFSYPLIQHWIDRFNEANPGIQVIIEPRGSADPAQYDILVEASEQPGDTGKDHEHVYVARYAVLPVANSRSAFAGWYADKGLNRELIRQLFFHDNYADKEKQQEIRGPFTVYTRLQKAGAPRVFARYFGYEQKHIRGKAIAGADEHLLKALLRDTTGLSYAPLPVVYDHNTRKPVDGIVVIPVDLNGNNKVSDEEKCYGSLDAVTEHLEKSASGHINNIPIAYIHFSISRKEASPEAITFLRWVVNNSGKDLHAFGYLKPEAGKPDKEKFEQFAAGRGQ